MHDGFKVRFWIGAGVIVSSIVAALVAFSYFSGAISAEADQIVMAKTKAGNDASSLASLASLETAAPQAAQYDVAIKQLIPDQSGLLGFSAWMGQAAARFQVNATVSYQGNPTLPSGDTPGNTGFTLTAQGSGGSMVPFLDYIAAKAPGFIISFTSVDFTNDRNQETVTAQGIAYFR